MAGVKWHWRQMLPYPKGCHRSWLRSLCESETRCKVSVTEVWSCPTLHLNLTFLMSLFFKHDYPASCPVSLSVPTSLLTFYNTFPIFLLYPPQYCLFFSAYLPSFSKAHTHFYTVRRHSSLSYNPNAWMRKTQFLSYLSSSELPDKTTTNPPMKLETAWTTVMWGQRDKKHTQLHSLSSGPCCFSTRARATV